MFRKLVPLAVIVAFFGVACSNSSSTTVPSVAPITTVPTTAPSSSSTLSQSQIISLVSTITGTSDNLRKLSSDLTAGKQDSAQQLSTQISTTMSQLRSSLNVYKQANWDTTGALFDELSKWRKDTANLTLEVIKSNNTKDYDAWAKQATKLADEGDSLKAQILVASGLSPGATPTP